MIHNSTITAIGIFCTIIQISATNYLGFINHNIPSKNITLVAVVNKIQFLVHTNVLGIHELHQQQCNFTLCDVIDTDTYYCLVTPQKSVRSDIEKYCSILHTFSDFYLVSLQSMNMLRKLKSLSLNVQQIPTNYDGDNKTKTIGLTPPSYQSNLAYTEK